MSALSQISSQTSKPSQMTLKNFLQERINALNISSKEQLKSPEIQARLAEILNGSGYEVKQVHWHKKNGSETDRWAELCDGHHHHKPAQSTATVSQAHDPAQQALHRCEGQHCATTREKKTPFWNQVLGLFQAA
jgi:hypothetical protein